MVTLTCALVCVPTLSVMHRRGFKAFSALCVRGVGGCLDVK